MLSALLEELGEKSWRAKPILRWIHRGRAVSFDEMTDLPATLRDSLAQRGRICGSRVAERFQAKDGTEKLLVELEDGEMVETVLIRERVETKNGKVRERTTACISTQAGCPIGCGFCASGMFGLRRNLEPDEIVEQLFHLQSGFPKDDRISSIVVMGIGEPLLNYDAVVRALKIWKAPWGCGVGFNRITLSTVGILPGIERLISDKVTPHLAISLHAPDDVVRARIVPSMQKTKVGKLMAAGVDYRKRTGKEVTFEYVLLGGVNDAPEQAKRLGGKLRGTKCKVNVIPFNRVEGLSYEAPGKTALDRFVEILGKCGVPVMVRRRKGDEVNAACGQLRMMRHGQ